MTGTRDKCSGMSPAAGGARNVGGMPGILEPDLTDCFAPEFRSLQTASFQFAPLTEEILLKITDSKFEIFEKM